MADNGRWSSWISGSEQLAASNTLPEHYSALALLQQLDHAWFHDNLLKPRVGLMDAFLPSSHRLSPYQSVELTNATHSKWAASLSSQHPRSGKMPCARFEPTPITHTRVATPISGNVLSEGRQCALECDYRLHGPPQSSSALVSQPLSDTILVPPASSQAWVVKDIRHLKESEINEGIKAGNAKSVEPGKQLTVSMVDGRLPQPILRVAGPKRMWRTSSRSMTALEFNELQGFMDLGFHVSQDDLTPRIVRMFPALQNKIEEDGSSKWNPRISATKPDQNSIATWLVRRSASPLQHWQAPATREDMKKHLKFWARAVASTVRQEC